MFAVGGRPDRGGIPRRVSRLSASYWAVTELDVSVSLELALV
jgi:hypothetical protein